MIRVRPTNYLLPYCISCKLIMEVTMDIVNSMADGGEANAKSTTKAEIKPQTETTRKDHTFWYPHIESCDKAGISGNRYCRKNNLSPTQFSYWRSKYRREHNSNNNSSNSSKNDFLGVKISKGNTTECLCSLEFSRGHRLLIHNLDCLRMLPQILSLIK